MLLGKRKGNGVIILRLGRPGFNLVRHLCPLYHATANGPSLSIWNVMVAPTALDWADLAGFAWWTEDLWATADILCQLSHG